MEKMPEYTPVRRYCSRLGTENWYPPELLLKGAGSYRKLDEEAQTFTAGAMGLPAIIPGMFRDKQVKVLLIAPKTRSLPPRAEGLHIEVYASPIDDVPNQRLFSAQPWHQYTRGGGCVWSVYNPEGSGLGRGHLFEGFMQPDLSIMRLLRRPFLKHCRRKWVITNNTAPDIMEVLRGWLSDPANDFVLVGHSQGANIAIFLLNAGYADTPE